jgi:hypothetical protein
MHFDAFQVLVSIQKFSIPPSDLEQLQFLESRKKRFEAFLIVWAHNL